MTIVYDHACLVSTVKNTSGVEKFFGFLPPHGRRLAADEELNVFGDLRESINRGDRYGARNMNSFLAALDRGDLEITSTPAPIAYDETLGNSQLVSIDNGAFSLAAPCWETSLSEI